MLFKNLFISSLIISSIFLLANTLPIRANNPRPNLENQNIAQNEEKSAKTQIEIIKIEYQKSNNLANSWDKIQQIIQSDETSLTFDSQLNLSKISFNLPIQIPKNKSLQDIINKSNEIKNSVLDSLIKQKNGEKEFLDSSVFDTTDKNMENLQEQMTILANLDMFELENLKTQNFDANLLANSLTITTNKFSQIQSENAKLSESNSTPSSEIQSSFSSSSLTVLPEITLPQSNFNSSSSEVSISTIVPKIKDLLEISENNSNNSNQNPSLITENLIQESNLENSLENLQIAKSQVSFIVKKYTANYYS